MHRIINQRDHRSRSQWLKLGITLLCIAAPTLVWGLNARAEEESLDTPMQDAEETQVTVASILADPTDGVLVRLEGKILQPGNDEGEYVFTDGTGEITLENFDQDFNFAPDTALEIFGEVNLESQESTQQETYPEEVEIDVMEFQVIKP